MDIEKIRKKLNNGFRKFTLCLSNGRRLTVPHPDFIAVSRKVVVVIDKSERVHTISPLHIVSIEEAAPK
jgi:hypothetical protein